MENEFKKSKATFGQGVNPEWLLGSFSVALLFLSFAFPQFTLAQTFTCDAGSAIDADKDGVPAPGGPLYSQLSPCPDNYPDCNDTDPWSHRYGSKDIASVKVAYAPAYVTKMQTDKKFTPDSKKFNPLLGNLLVTVTFKAKKCGVTANSIFMPMKAYYTTKDSSGNEISIGLQLIADTGSITASDNLVRVSDLVYRGSIPGVNLLTSDLEPYISSVAAGRSLQLKFLGPDIGLNKDTPKYQPLPMTNCAQVYGGGKHKVVYMRSYDTWTSLQGYFALANQAIYNGFNVIEPFREYQKEFSHYIDLKLQALPGVSLAKNLSLSQLKYDANMVKNSSSCGAKGSLYTLFDRGDNFSPRAAGLKTGVVIMDGEFIDEEEYAVDIGPITVHEAGHAFAGLSDEGDHYGVGDLDSTYKSNDAGTNNFFRALNKLIPSPNCSNNPNSSYSYGGKLYGKTNATPCLVKDFFNPSANSLMQGHTRGSENRFNVVSCGPILKAIKKGGTAKSYFPECAAMAARDGSIIPIGQ